MLCSCLYREVGRSVSQSFPGGVWALHVGPSFAKMQQRRRRVAPHRSRSWRGCHQPCPGTAQPQSGAAVDHQQPAGEGDGGRSEPPGWPALLDRERPAGGERHPGKISADLHSFCHWCQQHRQRQPAAAADPPGVRRVVKSVERRSISHKGTLLWKWEFPSSLCTLNFKVKSFQSEKGRERGELQGEAAFIWLLLLL